MLGRRGVTVVRRPVESGMAARTFDVVIAGGGLAGSSLGGVLARSGLGVLVVEKECGPDGLVPDEAARRMYFGE